MFAIVFEAALLTFVFDFGDKGPGPAETFAAPAADLISMDQPGNQLTQPVSQQPWQMMVVLNNFPSFS